MASVVLRSVGAAVGSSLFGPIGGVLLGTLGRSVGGLIDAKLGLGEHVTGPQLQNLSVQDSRYGAGIPIVYGQMRVAGNVIWATDLIQATHNNTASGGKGGGGSVSSTTYTYSVHCAVGIALGPIGGIATIWADSNIIYQNGVWASGTVDSAVIYTGTSSQAPDSFMESILGAGTVPAYRGLAYIVLDNLQLSGFGNRLPNLTFEIFPLSVTSAPKWLGGLNASIDQFQPTAQGGGLLPIPLGGSASEVSTVLVGGYLPSGPNYIFEVVEYDVTNSIPSELARIQSASFSGGTAIDSSWALAPDGRFVAIYLQFDPPTTHSLAIYDTETATFGNVLTISIPFQQPNKQIAWIDPQHFVMYDASGTQRGVRAFARAGLNVIDLGFFNVWGTGSTATRFGMISYAHFIPYADGLIIFATDGPAGPTFFTTIYACTIVWRNNGVVAGTPYVVATGITTGSGSGPHMNLVETGDGEWTFCLGTVIDYHLISFIPGATSATVTRPWQDFTLSFGIGTTNFPVYYGDRLVIVQRPFFQNNYALSEILLTPGSFTLGLNAVLSTGANAITLYFNGIRLDQNRILLTGVSPSNWDIGQFGIIERGVLSDGLDAIMANILSRAGYAPADYDVTALSGAAVDGYVISTPMPARGAIESLQAYAPFDLVESAGVLVAVPRGAVPAVVVPSSEWRAGPDGKEPPPPFDVTRAQELDLPVEIDVDYIDPARDFEVNCQRARRIASRAKAVQKMQLPIVCDADTAKQVAETKLYSLWAERELVRVRISRTWLALDPADVIDLGNGNLLRITRITQSNGLLEVEGFYANANVYASDALGDTGITTDHPGITPLSGTLYLMDLPLLQSADDEPGVYAAASGLPGWTESTLFRASDGVNYSKIATLPTVATAGIAVTALANGPGTYIDNAATVNVQLLQGELANCTQADLLNGANAALLGGEIIQFQNVVLLGPGLYQLSGLLRGRRGTEAKTATHSIGENFVMLTTGPVDFVPALLTDRNAVYEFRVLRQGQTLSDAQDSDFAYGLQTICPFSPVNLQGTRASGVGSDLTINWKRRARLNADWVDFIDVPLDEPQELYNVSIMNGTSAVRTFTSVAAPTVTYTGANQSADWGTSIPSSFSVQIQQVSSRFGPGNAALASV
jgi:hypothetical protein